MWLWDCHRVWDRASIDLLHKSHNPPVPYPTMHHFITEMCTYVYTYNIYIYNDYIYETETIWPPFCKQNFQMHFLDGKLLNFKWKFIEICCSECKIMSCTKQTLGVLTQWGWVTNICVNKQTNMDSDNGLLPGWLQAIIWTNAGILLTGPLGTNFSEILIKIYTFWFKKMHLKMLSGKWQPFCLHLIVLTTMCHPEWHTCGQRYPFIPINRVLSPHQEHHDKITNQG